MTLGTVIINNLPLASRPAAGIEGRLFFPTDVGATYAYYDTGSTWNQISIQGPTGPTGPTGSAATISVGSTATGSAGSSAIVSNSGTSSAAVLDFVIPQGTSGVVAATSPLAYNSGTQTVSISGIVSIANGGTGASSIPLVIGFAMGSGATGTGLAYAVAPRAGTVSKCKILVKGSDGSTDLTFKIKKNGTDVFSSDPTITHGASAGSLTTSTSLTSSPLTIAADDIFSLDITSGTATWQFTAQLES